MFLVNPDGILFGLGASINVGGLLATTNDIANNDFMAGRYNFIIPGNPNASIVNMGTITAQTGGFAALVAPGVRNTGTITAKLGTVALASGNAFTLDIYGDNLITLGLTNSIASQVMDVSTGQPLKSLVGNEGKLKANGGTVDADRGGGARGGQFRHQQYRRDRGQLDRQPQRHDRARRGDRRPASRPARRPRR